MLLHIMDDLKIACALMNCFFVKKQSDVEDGIEIAQEMKKNLLQKNDLEKYLRRSSKSLFEKIDISELEDFPKMTADDTKKKITFGCYQINQALSYLAEHFDQKGDFEIRIEKTTKTDGEHRIVSSNFYSRHSNNCQYFTVLKYEPHNIISKWICSCLSGRRTCGCCSHVASLIYFLSYARFQSEPLKKPGSSLNNLLLCIKKDEFSEDEVDDNVSNDEVVENECIVDDDELVILSQIIDVKEQFVPNIKRILSINDQLSQSSKKKQVSTKPLSNQSSLNSSQLIKSSQVKNYVSSFTNNISFREFSSHIPKWGGVIETFEEDFESQNDFSKYSEYRNLAFNSTCTIDYFLLGMWSIS